MKILVFDIGGTAIKYGIIYEDAEIICKRSMKTEAWKGGPAILQKVTGIVEEMKQEAQEEMLRSWRRWMGFWSLLLSIMGFCGG